MEVEFRCRVQNTGYKDAQRTHWVLQQHKKDPGRNKEQLKNLIEIKNNLQGSNSRMDKAKNQINYLEHKEGKNNQSEQQEKKRV